VGVIKIVGVNTDGETIDGRKVRVRKACPGHVVDRPIRRKREVVEGLVEPITAIRGFRLPAAGQGWVCSLTKQDTSRSGQRGRSKQRKSSKRNKDALHSSPSDNRDGGLHRGCMAIPPLYITQMGQFKSMMRINLGTEHYLPRSSPEAAKARTDCRHRLSMHLKHPINAVHKHQIAR